MIIVLYPESPIKHLHQRRVIRVAGTGVEDDVFQAVPLAIVPKLRDRIKDLTGISHFVVDDFNVIADLIGIQLVFQTRQLNRPDRLIGFLFSVYLDIPPVSTWYVWFYNNPSSLLGSCPASSPETDLQR